MRDVTIVYHQELEGWWADSPQVSGYVATGETLAEVRELVREGLPFFLDDEDIQIFEALEDDFVPMKVSFEFQGPLTGVGVATYGPPVVYSYSSPSASRHFDAHDLLTAASA